MIQVRPCCAEDFDAVRALLAQLWPDKPLPAASARAVYDRALASDRQAYLCAVDGGKVVGFGSLTIKNTLWPEGPLVSVDELVVDEKHRGRGIGTKLLAGLVSLAEERGCRRVELDSAHHRKEAHQFYQQQGFENRACLFSKALMPGPAPSKGKAHVRT